MGIPFGCYQCRGFNPTCSQCGGAAYHLRQDSLIWLARRPPMKTEMTADEQLTKWVGGVSSCPNERGECCPDFSCCTGKIAPLIEREAFAKAHRGGDEATRERMCMGFLGAEFLSEDICIADPDAARLALETTIDA